MRVKLAVAILVVPFIIVLGLSLTSNHLRAQRVTPAAAAPGTFDAVIEQNHGDLFNLGRQIFRGDTFGDERFWSDTLKLRMRVHQRREIFGPLNMRTNHVLNALTAKVAHYKPQLQRAETMAERNAIIHQVVCAWIILCLQIIWRE